MSLENESDLVPIGLSTYIRLDHLKRTIEALEKNSLAAQSELYVFSDGPKPGDEAAVIDVRRYLKGVTGFKRVLIIERSDNDRVRNNRGGLKFLLDKHGAAIFLEEDVETSPIFLQYMNDSLIKYKDNSNVFSISGYSPNIEIPSNFSDQIYLFRRFNAWGFGIWKDRFEKVDYISKIRMSRFLRSPIQVLNFIRGAGGDAFTILFQDASGAIDAWDAKAFYWQFLHNQYTAYPVRSLTFNHGHDGTGLHCGTTNKFDVELNTEHSVKLPEKPTSDERIRRSFTEFRRVSRKRILRIWFKGLFGM